MPGESFNHTTVASASIDDVWAALDLPLTWESIGGIDHVVDSVTDSQGRLQSFSFDSIVAGNAYRGEATSAEREERKLMAWNIVNSEIAGVISVTLTEAGSGTKIRVDLTVESRGILASMFFAVISKTIGDGLPQSVDAFAAGFGLV